MNQDLSRFQAQALESSISGIAFTDLDGRITYVNPAFLRLWGYDNASEVMGRHASAFSMSDEQTRAVFAALREQGAWVGEVAVRKKSGEPFVVEVSSSLVKDADGHPVGMMGSFVDVTDRSRIAQALHENEEKYRSLIESAQDPIFVSDADGRYLYVNRAAAATLGMTPETMTGKSADDLFPPHVATQQRANVRRVIETGETLRSEDRSEVNGVEVWFSVVLQPLRDREGRITAAQGIVRDVTGRKQVEEALRASEERLRQVLLTSNIGVVEVDFVARTVFWSPQTRAIWGWGADEPILWDQHLQHVHPDDRDQLNAAIDRTHHSVDGVFEVEHRINRRDGSERCLLIRGQAFFEGEGAHRRLVRFISAVRDVTSERLADAEKAGLQAQLVQAQKLESVGRLAGGIAHDFNNILNVIIGCAEMAASDVDPASVKRYLHEILGAAKRSADLTKQLLGFARRQTVMPRPVDLNDFVSASLKMLGRLIGEQVTLSWHPGVDVWPVRIDPTQVDQILVNLAANARDAIAGVGTVVIHTENIPASSTAMYPNLPRGEYVRLAVVDNGQGMDPETQRQLFEPFYTTKALGHGTGLGMASVDGIVRQNGGMIDVTSAVGQGTTVSVFLPRVVAAVAGDASGVMQAPQKGSETVLVVEDEPALLRLAVRALEMIGYNVLSAGSPDEAIALASTHTGPLHILVTDVVMPGMNGRSLADRLREIKPQLKCLFVSGYSVGVMGPGGLLDEHVHFLQKPFSPRALAEKVRQVLEA
jgi:two-component system cell cycle sensor histidine kinase/response regulator CckA